MMPETSKHVPKTEKRCCVFKENLNLRIFLTMHRDTLPVTRESNFPDIFLSTTQFFREFYWRDPWTAQATLLKLPETTWMENVVKSHFIRFDFQKKDLCFQLGFCFVLCSFGCSSFQLPFIWQNKRRSKIKSKTILWIMSSICDIIDDT